MKWIKASKLNLTGGKEYIAKWKKDFVNSGQYYEESKYFQFDAADLYGGVKKSEFDDLYILTPDESTEEVKEQDSKTMEDVLMKHYNYDEALTEYETECIMKAMREWETITNSERDEEIKSWKESKESWEYIANERDEKIRKQEEEIERLKGLIESYYIAYECQKYLRVDIKLTDIQIEKMWQQFKTENNL